MNCPECNHEIECMVTYGPDKTLSGQTERLYLCNHCLSTWEQIGESEDLKRYFFG